MRVGLVLAHAAAVGASVAVALALVALVVFQATPAGRRARLFQLTWIKGKSEAEAAKSLKVFQQDPDLANFLFRLNALEGSLKERSILVFDQNMPPFDLLRGGTTNWLSK